MKRLRVILSVIFVLSGVLFLGEMETVGAFPTATFDFTFSGESAGNDATATGFITGYFPNPSTSGTLYPNTDILALSITVSGAASGNGTFGLNDFDSVNWVTGGVTLDFTKELVGQPTLIDPWGTDSEGDGGDFNLFGKAAPAPYGEDWFWLGADGGSGDQMRLTSMRMESVSTPEPTTMLLLGLGLVGLAGFRRKFKG